VFAPFLKNMTQHTEQQEVEKVSVTKRIIVKPPTPPPPTPTPPPPKETPKPQVKPQSQPQPKLKLNVPHTTSKGPSTSTVQKYVPPKTGTEQGAPTGVGTAPPAPPAPTAPPGTPKPACKVPFQDAQATNAVTPDYPEEAREAGMGEAQATVVVTISPSGSLVSATIGQSTGNTAMDNAAVAAARQSTYAPKIVDCQAVQGTYNFKVTFDPNS
jgi:protein TonB